MARQHKATTTTLDLTAPWQIVTTHEAPPVQLAISELQTHWRKISGQNLAHDDPAANGDYTIQLSVAAGHTDGFTWQANRKSITIEGQSTRGLLFGVYAFLEALGCRWLAPETWYTHIPKVKKATVPAAVSEEPAFVGRCLIIGHYAFMVDCEAWIEWAARNRFNTIFFHTAPNDIGGGSVPEWAWQRYRERAMTLLHARGMTVEIGGHGLPALLPRDHFKTMPDAFRLEDGKRTKRHNFCPSSPQAKTIVQENARRYFEEHPGFAVYHLWADDIPGGGWCGCDQCAELSSSDQLLLATNMVAEVLAEVHPQAELSFIAYLDTEQAPTQVTPLPNVCLVWAPRPRNYGKALNDPKCSVNVPHYPTRIQAQIAHFADAGTVRVFEYYSDALLFKSVLPILNNVMQRDLRFYHESGVHTIQTLMTGDRPWQSAQLTNWLFGRLSWQPDADLDALVADFCRATFGPAAWEPMIRYYRALEAAFALVLHQTPDQRQEQRFPSSPLDLLRNPMTDVEDPVHASAATLRQRAAETTRLQELIDEAEDQYFRARELDATVGVEEERAEFALTKAWLTFAGARIRLYAALADDAPEAEVKPAWSAANDAYRDVLRWARILASPFRQNMQVLHLAMWGLRLRRIQADHLTPGYLRWWVDLRSLARLAWLGLRTYQLYKREKRG